MTTGSAVDAGGAHAAPYVVGGLADETEGRAGV
jgi:hypothetical protein